MDEGTNSAVQKKNLGKGRMVGWSQFTPTNVESQTSVSFVNQHFSQ